MTNTRIQQIFAFLFLLLFLGKNAIPEEKISPPPPKFPEADLAINNARKHQAESDPHIPEKYTIFIGDSITQRLETKKIIKESINYGIGWQRSDQLIESIDLYKSLSRASHVVVMIGTNDLMQGYTSGIEDRYKKIIEKIPYGPIIFFVSPPPIGDIFVFGRKITGSDMKNLALSAKSACSSYRRCNYINAHEALTINEKPIPGILLDDQVHLSKLGYEKLINLLQDEITRKHLPQN